MNRRGKGDIVMKLYKGDKTMQMVDKDQVDICLEAGWSKKAPEPVVDVDKEEEARKAQELKDAKDLVAKEEQEAKDAQALADKEAEEAKEAAAALASKEAAALATKQASTAPKKVIVKTSRKI